MSYSDEIIEKVKAKNPNEPEFIQAVTEVMNSLRLVVDNDPKYQIFVVHCEQSHTSETSPS